ncbi:CobW family GTP-binding protein [Haloimpatiens sp. FM7330]|uniref:CobW family GTP-binding protein n=1 Tax=Haloimpatiens sp. FM7330 TaxID=3298610 RepID=UPI003641343A
MKQKIKLYFITGFLGSGKTTLMNKLIGHFKENKIGVVVNEFGKEGIDGERIKNSHIELTEINNGSIFCLCLKGTFIKELGNISKLPLEYVFVESSGLSDPISTQLILDIINKEYGDVYDFQGTITLADSTNLLELIQVIPAVERQIQYTNYIIINKCDLVSKERLENVKNKVKEINKDVNLITTSYCKLPDAIWTEISGLKDEFMNSSEAFDINNKANCCTNTPENKPQNYVLTCNNKLNKIDFENFLRDVCKYVYRIKGDVLLDGEWMQIDAAGSNISIVPTERIHHQSKIVLITAVREENQEVIKKNIEDLWNKNLKCDIVFG